MEPQIPQEILDKINEKYKVLNVEDAQYNLTRNVVHKMARRAAAFGYSLAMQEIKSECLEFASWLESERYKFDYREQKTHTNEELYHYYLQIK